MFHLFVHAFFKSLLFMGAGCVILLLADERDIFRMGGMARRAPAVFWSFLAGALCLAGAPLTGGFFSKDGILITAFARGTPYYQALWGIGLFAAFLTALYTFRLVYLVFAGEARTEPERDPLPKKMIWTLFPLAVAALAGGLLNLPRIWGGWPALAHQLGSLGGTEARLPAGVEWGLTALAILFFLAGWLGARQVYLSRREKGTGAVKGFFLAGWKADRLVDLLVVIPFRNLARFFWLGSDKTVIDGFLDATGRGCHRVGDVLRRMTTGRLTSYVSGFAWGLLGLLGLMLIQMLR